MNEFCFWGNNTDFYEKVCYTVHNNVKGMAFMEENHKYSKKLKQFRRKINAEAILRAVITGLAAGLGKMAAVLLFGRLVYQELMLQEAGLAAIVLWLAVTVFCYVVLFKPKNKEVLARIDSLGLEERIITMEELKHSDTVMAKKQRQDALEHLEELDSTALGFKVYIKPMLWCLGLAALVVLLFILPFPKPEIDEQAEQNAAEIVIVDEMIATLQGIVKESELSKTSKAELNEIVDALAVSFTPEDSTLTRTAKIATASKRLDLYESGKASEITLQKQQSDGSEAAGEAIKEAEKEQKKLTSVIKKMKNIMGTSIDVLNKVEGTFWTPGGPSSGTSYDVTPLPFEQEPAEEEPQEGMEPGEGEEPPEGMESGEGEGEPPEDMEGEGFGGQTIFDPEQGEVGYGSVYEEYYKEILKALTEQEFSEELRKIIEDYANSLE